MLQLNNSLQPRLTQKIELDQSGNNVNFKYKLNL